VDEPTAPFGLLDVQGESSEVNEARIELSPDLARQMRASAARLGVSVASLCHQAWAQVLARLTDREDVVFGTVLFGRMHGGAGADRGMGLFINTLPVRIDVDERSVETGVLRTHELLTRLLRHEHAPLALAQRCSGVHASMPLFTSLLNYRHSALAASEATDQVWEGFELLGGEERTNYPLMMSADDLGEQFVLTTQAVARVDAGRVCGLMEKALSELVDALREAPSTSARELDVLPVAERELVVGAWSAGEAEFEAPGCVHELFEEQVVRDPGAVAVVCGPESLTYAELNARANQVAWRLRGLGVGPDSRVAVCAERGVELVVGLLGVLKAGGAYVPLDPAYPSERLALMLSDCEPVAVLMHGRRAGVVMDELGAGPVVDLGGDFSGLPVSDVDRGESGLTSSHLAYVLYTSGSTGVPKGVMVEHRNTVNFVLWAVSAFDREVLDRTLFSTSINFDLSVFELFVPLAVGASVVVVRDAVSLVSDPVDVSLVNTVPSVMSRLVELGGVPESVRTVDLAGEPLSRDLVERIFATTG
ncbi:AMP-binding protein, partial [Streptomyces sp. 5-6(2022)]|uniref:AMP-binding protein n=1 Tax=Streptomyces sp. 5-6(2022) TaxID=2936510 RepID=UPI0023B88EAF